MTIETTWKEFCKKVKVRYTRTHDRSALTVAWGKSAIEKLNILKA